MPEDSVSSYAWRNIGGAMLRMPLVRQIIGHEEPQNLGLGDRKKPESCAAIIRAEDFLGDLYPGTKKRRRILRSRPTDVDTLAIHQMDAIFGTSRQQRKKFGGALPALIGRMAMQPYHVSGLLSGPVVIAHHPKVYTYASSKANRFSVGVGLEGRWPGFEKRRKAKHTEPSDQILATYKQAIRTAYDEATAWGCKIKYVTAHRCWSKNRRPDPGEWIWKNVVLPMMEELGLTLHPGTKDGGVLPPVEWGFTGFGGRTE
jgi:hypothetical protein